MNQRPSSRRKSRRPLLRTLALGLTIALVTCGTVLLASDLLSGSIQRRNVPEGIPQLEEPMRALTVYTQGNTDFPIQPDMPAKELKEQLEELASFANTYGYNAIFFEAVPQMDALYRSKLLPSSSVWTGGEGLFTFFDPLGYLVDEAKTYGIQVYALVAPLSGANGSIAQEHPDWFSDGFLDLSQTQSLEFLGEVCQELTSNYDLGGIVFHRFEENPTPTNQQISAMEALFPQAKSQLAQDGQRLGVITSGDALTNPDGLDLVSQPAASGALDFVVPSYDNGAQPDPDLLSASLSAWQGLGLPYYPLHQVSDDNIFTHEADNSIYYENQYGASGSVISSYGSLNSKNRLAASLLASTFRQQSAQLPEMDWPQILEVTRPTETLTVSSDTSAYFVTGTSDPSQPVLYKGKELERNTETGLWGALVAVDYGQNTYTFSQPDGSTTTAVITRPEPSEGSSSISAIIPSSAYPSYAEAVLSGEKLKLSCTAPYGGKVTAKIGSLSAELKPVSTAQEGTPVTYQTTLDVSSLTTSGRMDNVGKVTYQLSYNGYASTQESAGEVYVAGKGIVPVVKMVGYMTPISKNGQDDGVYSTLLKDGCVDYITENTGGYYKLGNGGYVLKQNVEILEGEVTAQNEATGMILREGNKGEELVIRGSLRPAFSGFMEDGTVSVTLYNMSGIEYLSTSSLESQLCDSIQMEEGEDNSLTLTFQLKETTDLLGWDVRFQDNDTIIYLKQRPVLKLDTGKPLEGITIVVDPGHGGDDPGAAGVPYNEGPWEKTLNLADAKALENRLTAMGAEVYLTQEDSTMSMNDRMAFAEEKDADLFISCHHNSIGTSTDANTVSGIEVYYYNSQSQRLAEQVGASLSEDTGRTLRFTQQSWYRVTMNTLYPAILLESGFLTNPVEYENIASEYGMHLYANAVADGVLHYFR